MMKKTVGILIGMFLLCGVANATTITRTSLTSKGLLPAGVTEIGGIVLDLVGSNGARVVSQLAASSLYVGFFTTNPGTIGTQTGFDASVMSALGGGINEAAVRLTLFDGDTASGNFDWNMNTLQLNGTDFGNFSDVFTDRTDSSGLTSYATEYGFQDNALNTGFFYSNEATILSSLYNSLLNTNELIYSLLDVDPYDNYFDFTDGVDGSLIDVGTGPVVTPPSNPIPEPATMLLFGIGLLGLAGVNRKKQ
ncbi:MAG: PEP-CTERM sorting domain-containing protein [Desulfobacterium sp.]|nr:PEP-CTERM sorting domain-containing protein [Desulfobacterium sp.]